MPQSLCNLSLEELWQLFPIILTPHQSCWALWYEKQASALRAILPAQEVHRISHIGSTAIKTIAAKPIIDIAVALDDMESVALHIDEMPTNGMEFRGSDIPGQLLFIIGDNNIRTHHIHIVEWKSKAWNDYIAVRDYLNANPDKAAEYEDLKRKLCSLYPDNRKAYTAGKEEFIRSIIEEAEA